MNPAAILFVLSLAGPLDSPRFAVREQTQQTIERMPFADCWPAVYALSVSRKLEISERASRYLSRLENEFAEDCIWHAVNDPIESKPWRKVAAIELAQKDQKRWREKWTVQVYLAMSEKHGCEVDWWTIWADDYCSNLGIQVFDVRCNLAGMGCWDTSRW